MRRAFQMQREDPPEHRVAALQHLEMALAKSHDEAAPVFAEQALAFVKFGGGSVHEPGQPGAVDLSGRGPEPVPGAIADDRVRTARAPGPRHQHLQALQAVARGVVAPDELNRIFRAAPDGSPGPRAQPAAPAGGRPQPVSLASSHRPAG